MIDRDGILSDNPEMKIFVRWSAAARRLRKLKRDALSAAVSVARIHIGPDAVRNCGRVIDIVSTARKLDISSPSPHIPSSELMISIT